MHAVKAEWTKLMRPGMLLGGAGLLVGLMTFATAMIVVSALPEPPVDAMAPPGMRPTEEQLESSEGALLIFGILVHIVGVVSAVIFAQGIGAEYSNATLKTMLTREPRRLVFLAGKVVATATFIGAAMLVGMVVVLGAGGHVASSQGLDLSGWLTDGAWTTTLGGLARLFVAALVQGFIGLALGLLLRAPGPAVGAAAGYVLAVEPLIMNAWSASAEWLPGPVLTAFTRGGTEAISLATATALVALYAAILLAVGGAVIARRDVTA